MTCQSILMLVLTTTTARADSAADLVSIAEPTAIHEAARQTTVHEKRQNKAHNDDNTHQHALSTYASLREIDAGNALEEEAGVTVVRDGGPLSSVRMAWRGLSGARLQFDLDGMPLNDPASGSFDVAMLPWFALQNLHISDDQRISVRTSKTRKTNTTVSFLAGSLDTMRLSGTHTSVLQEEPEEPEEPNEKNEKNGSHAPAFMHKISLSGQTGLTSGNFAFATPNGEQIRQNNDQTRSQLLLRSQGFLCSDVGLFGNMRHNLGWSVQALGSHHAGGVAGFAFAPTEQLRQQTTWGGYQASINVQPHRDDVMCDHQEKTWITWHILSDGRTTERQTWQQNNRLDTQNSVESRAVRLGGKIILQDVTDDPLYIPSWQWQTDIFTGQSQVNSRRGFSQFPVFFSSSSDTTNHSDGTERKSLSLHTNGFFDVDLLQIPLRFSADGALQRLTDTPSVNLSAQSNSQDFWIPSFAVALTSLPTKKSLAGDDGFGWALHVSQQSRAPTLEEMYAPVGFVVGNPDLRAESSTDAALSLRYQQNQQNSKNHDDSTDTFLWRSELRLFAGHIGDMIVFVNQNAFTVSPANTGAGWRTGGEWSWQIEPIHDAVFGKLQLHTHAAVLFSRLDVGGASLPTVPFFSAGWSSTWILPSRLQFSLRMRHHSESSSNLFGTLKVDPYTIFDGTLALPLGEHVEASLYVDNLFDVTTAQDANLLPLAGRQLYGSLTVHW